MSASESTVRLAAADEANAFLSRHPQIEVPCSS